MINKTRKIDKVSFIRIKNVCSAKEIVKKMKKPSTDQLKISENQHRIYIQNILKKKKQQQLENNSIKKWPKNLNQHFIKEYIWIENMHMEIFNIIR